MARDSMDWVHRVIDHPLVRKWASWVLGAVFVAAMSWVKGWEAGLVRAPSLTKLERRVVVIEQWKAGAITTLEEVRALHALVDEALRLGAKNGADLAALDEDGHRDVLRAIVSASRARVAVPHYDALLKQRISPHNALDIVLGWSRPPGR